VIRIVVAGIPYGQPRARSCAVYSRAKGRWMARAFDPKHPNDGWKAAVAHEAGMIVRSPLTGAVVIESMEFRMPRPKGHRGKRGLRPSAPREHCSKPDLDNMAKSVKDALRGIAWIDDCQVIGMRASKRYAEGGEQPGLELVIRPA